VIEAVHRQDAIVGVLPMPRRDDADPWWRHLATCRPDTPRIIARLPFAGYVAGRSGTPEALAICPISVKPTGRDRSFIAAEWESPLGLDQLARVLRHSGLVQSLAAVWREQEAPRSWLYLAEVEGWLAPNDVRLQHLRQTMSTPPKRLLLVGGYAVPLDDEMLGPPPAAAQGLQSVRAAKGENAATL
jgi:hypothetical protein